MTEFRCGYVALVGRPNAGKSTLMNQMLGGKLAITSAKPQTTRNRIAGISTDASSQIIVVDTPGIHRAWTELNKAMVKRAVTALDDVDVVCWLGDMTELAQRVKQNKPVLDVDDDNVVSSIEACGKPIVFVANKIDAVDRPLILPVFAAVQARLEPAALVPVSALTGDGVDALRAEIVQRLPEMPALYPEDTWTQVTERFLVAEIVREKIFHLTEQEVPYATHVEVLQFDESRRDSEGRIRILCDIAVERKSQKGILIGKGGEMLKRIGTLSRKELNGLLDARVHLELHVKVERDWTRSQRGLRKVGFEEP